MCEHLTSLGWIWISNYMPSTLLDEISYTFGNFNDCASEFGEWIRKTIPHIKIDWCDYLTLLELKAVHVSKGDPWWPLCAICNWICVFFLFCPANLLCHVAFCFESGWNNFGFNTTDWSSSSCFSASLCTLFDQIGLGWVALRCNIPQNVDVCAMIYLWYKTLTKCWYTHIYIFDYTDVHTYIFMWMHTYIDMHIHVYTYIYRQTY